MKTDYKVVIIGAGVVGLAVARGLALHNIGSILIIEKEDGFGRGISSRNSEVIHSGIYYPKNSLKVKYCLEGREKLYPFCKKNDVWHSRCGKLVVAQKGQENELSHLFQNAQINGVPDLAMIGKNEISSLEPKISAESALFIGCTGIVSAHELMIAFQRISAEADHDLLVKATVMGAKVESGIYSLSVEGPGDASYDVKSEWVVNSAGLSSSKIASFLWKPDKNKIPEIRFSKGSYFKLGSQWRHEVAHLIYPIPDKEHDSLGIHLSFDAAGDLKLGPDADWLENKVENYNIPKNIIEKFFSAGKRYLPSLKKEDLSPDFAGIRPKRVVEESEFSDFYISHEEDKGFPGWINLLGIDSPGLTSAIAIGEDVAKWIAGV